jgi:hypothetical protein
VAQGIVVVAMTWSAAVMHKFMTLEVDETLKKLVPEIKSEISR